MFDQELLQSLTENYLKSLISEASNSPDAEFDSYAPFGELGIDSFFVLKILKRLENDFGTLPKTLLFENFNINALAGYFVEKHSQVLLDKFSDELAEQPGQVKAEVKAQPQAAEQQPLPAEKPEVAEEEQVQQAHSGPVLMAYKDAIEHPELKESLSAIYEEYKNESSVSRGTKNIAPHLFFGSERKGYFNYSRSNKIILAYAYTGPEDYFDTLCEEIHQHCREQQLELNILVDKQITAVGDTEFTATPYGAVQRVLNLESFTLGGGKMRRLRYLVTKFEKAGECQTREYLCGTDKATDQAIADMIDKWCQDRAMVNPLVHLAKEQILAGTFSHEHRIFLTYMDEVLQNVIIISAMAGVHSGYLMDLEFYGKDMPLGGLEYTIAQIIDILVPEGVTMFSLGATFGPKLAESSNADPQVDKLLDELREQNIFNDGGNLQFKNKFRPENKTIFLCRAADAGNADNVIDIVMMVADPAKMQTPDDENYNFPVQAGGKPQAQPVPQATPAAAKPQTPAASVGETSVLANNRHSLALGRYGYNPLNVPAEEVTFDLKNRFLGAAADAGY